MDFVVFRFTSECGFKRRDCALVVSLKEACESVFDVLHISGVYVRALCGRRRAQAEDDAKCQPFLH